MPPLGIAVIGCGRVSDYGHLPAVAALAEDGAVLAAVADRDEAAPARVRGQFPGVPSFADYRAVLARDDADVAVGRDLRGGIRPSLPEVFL